MQTFIAARGEGEIDARPPGADSFVRSDSPLPINEVRQSKSKLLLLKAIADAHPGKLEDEARIGRKGRACHRWYTKSSVHRDAPPSTFTYFAAAEPAPQRFRAGESWIAEVNAGLGGTDLHVDIKGHGAETVAAFADDLEAHTEMPHVSSRCASTCVPRQQRRHRQPRLRTRAERQEAAAIWLRNEPSLPRDMHI